MGSVGLSEDFIPLPGEATCREAEPASLDELVARMEAEEFDLVAVGRAMIANPEWANLVNSARSAELRAFEKEMLFSLA